MLDADIRGFFDPMAQSWIIRFLEHRIALGCRRVDHHAHARYFVNRKAAQLRMRAHRGFVWRTIVPLTLTRISIGREGDLFRD